MFDFSFIIPVYNAGKTIEKCLESIRTQHYENYEVILMDDGSSDDSYEICTRYQDRDNRFRVYHQNNGGPSVARNKCLDVATGKWICFVDSDDIIDSNYLEKIHKIIVLEEPEVVFIGYKQINAFGEEIDIKLPGYVKQNYLETLVELSDKDMYGYTWIKCFKRECIAGIRFNEDLTLFEDEVFTCEVLKNCNHISFINEALYSYCIGDDGALTHRTYQDYCKKCDYVFAAWENLLETYYYASIVLQNKASTYVDRCRYYGLERAVNIKEFYTDLAETHFFALCAHKNFFEKNVLNQNYVLLKLDKLLYNLKMKVAKLVGR